ncbi:MULTISPECIES: hypothetical protein [Citrobacter]|uniref:hypothetical protein n=1 Tax=Citrobacter TaxID=544 RepID=UPI001428BE53|nr:MULTISPECIES: hypothetical protein [Citrobacter]MDN8555273.1 hypothetical protein [Citrobacter werkmanii]UCA27536.1 hypothetical protein LA356_10560 [Citrobacter werkmanii]
MKKQALCTPAARLARFAIAGNTRGSGMRHNSLFLTELDLLQPDPAMREGELLGEKADDAYFFCTAAIGSGGW